MGTLLPREKHKAAYDKALVQRYQHMPDIRRIARHRHVPAAIYKARGLIGSIVPLQICACFSTVCCQV
jgi:hypothetical protein